MDGNDAARAFEQPRADGGKRVGPRPDGQESERQQRAEGGNYEGVRGDSGDGQAVEIDNHRERESQLDEQ